MPNAYLALEAIEGGFLTHIGRVFIQLNSGPIGGLRSVAEDDRVGVEVAGVNDHHAPSCDRIAGDIDAANSQVCVFASIADAVVRQHAMKQARKAKL